MQNLHDICAPGLEDVDLGLHLVDISFCSWRQTLSTWWKPPCEVCVEGSLGLHWELRPTKGVIEVEYQMKFTVQINSIVHTATRTVLGIRLPPNQNQGCCIAIVCTGFHHPATEAVSCMLDLAPNVVPLTERSMEHGHVKKNQLSGELICNAGCAPNVCVCVCVCLCICVSQQLAMSAGTSGQHITQQCFSTSRDYCLFCPKETFSSAMCVCAHSSSLLNDKLTLHMHMPIAEEGGWRV